MGFLLLHSHASGAILLNAFLRGFVSSVLFLFVVWVARTCSLGILSYAVISLGVDSVLFFLLYFSLCGFMDRSCYMGRRYGESVQRARLGR